MDFTHVPCRAAPHPIRTAPHRATDFQNLLILSFSRNFALMKLKFWPIFSEFFEEFFQKCFGVVFTI
jgi:hypothetical protein